MHYVQKKKLLFITVPRISANSNENVDVITSQTFANISRNIKFPESLQPYMAIFGVQIPLYPVGYVSLSGIPTHGLMYMYMSLCSMMSLLAFTPSLKDWT